MACFGPKFSSNNGIADQGMTTGSISDTSWLRMSSMPSSNLSLPYSTWQSTQLSEPCPKTELSIGLPLRHLARSGTGRRIMTTMYIAEIGLGRNHPET
jgi:hypothetical protein